MPYRLATLQYTTAAEHLIGTLSPCETSIVYLLAEFEPLTIATVWQKEKDLNLYLTVLETVVLPLNYPSIWRKGEVSIPTPFTEPFVFKTKVRAV